MTGRDLTRLFAPESIAIVGASANPAAIGGQPIAFLQAQGFAGRIYPVNPKYPEVAGLPCYPALADLLRVLLKAKTESSGVAAKLIATSSDLDAIAAGERDLPALHGWRLEVFGSDALRLCDGKIALAAKGQTVRTVEL